MVFSKDEMFEIEKMGDHKATALSGMLSEVIKELIVLEDKKRSDDLHDITLTRLYWIKESLRLVDGIRKKCEQQRGNK